MAYQPDHYDFTVRASSTWRDVFTMYPTATAASPINLTGYGAALVVKETAGAASAYLSLTAGSGITLGGASGTIEVTQGASQTGNYDWQDGEYSLTLIASGGDSNTLLTGRVHVVRF